MFWGERRLVLALVACVCLGPLAACRPASEPEEAVAAPARRGPNVLIFVTDDQRAAGSLETMGAMRKIFKRNGTYFPNAYATTPLCCPSRASIMSGRYAHNHRVRSHRETAARHLDQDRTLQAILKRAGYRTGLYGKYLNPWDLEIDPPYFDRFSFFSSGAPYRRGTYNVDGELRSTERYSTRFIADQALGFLQDVDQTEDEKPWFLYVATSAPHGPAIAEYRYRDSHISDWDGNPAVFEEDRSDKPPWIQKRNSDIEDGRQVRASALRSLRSVDDLVERTFATLRQLEERNTIAFFVSDNGKQWGEHGVVGKTRPYTNSIQVPLLMRWPGRVGRGVRDDRIAANIDIVPTILRATNVDSRLTFDGRSLLGDRTRDRILLEYWKSPDFGTPPWASIRTPTYQYVEHYRLNGTVRFREYYDLVEDPWQLRNLLGDDDRTNDPDTITLHNELARARECRGRDCP